MSGSETVAKIHIELQWGGKLQGTSSEALTQERPKCALHHGKMSTNKCRARYEITHEHVSNDLKMWIKRLHTEIHNMITIYIHYKSIYFKIITCIILGLVNSNVFACKTNSAFNDFVDSCVTGKRNRTGGACFANGRIIDYKK